MRMFLSIFLVVLILGSWPVEAALSRPANAKEQKVINAGSSVKTEFFEIKIPEGWMMPQPVKNRPQAISAVFANDRADLVVTFNIMHANLSTADFVNGAVENMRNGRIIVAGPKKKNDFSILEISSPIKGEGWFICKEGLCSATMIMGGSAQAAQPVFKALKTSHPDLFPISGK